VSSALILAYNTPLTKKHRRLVTLAVQNAALAIIMHTSRTTIPTSRQYSAASAVFINELLKGSISLVIAMYRLETNAFTPQSSKRLLSGGIWRRISREIFSPDCWKLSIPAILYVFQNNLQYVAATNLDAATFQVTYQMKILTTAGFSVMLLHRQLSRTKWLALLFLAIGVGIVQIQNQTGNGTTSAAAAHSHAVEMQPLLGFLAVTAACFTSGLAGVYFEMVLKGSQADLWVRNVQLSLFSLLPAFLPALYDIRANGSSFPLDLFRNFGFWAWATVSVQVLGGLITAIVIKHADNILKGFATSLSIILSFVASVALFNFRVTPSFVFGAGVVLGATWMYNQPNASQSASKELPYPPSTTSSPASKLTSLKLTFSRAAQSKYASSSTLGSPIDSSEPILGYDNYNPSKRSSIIGLGLSPSPSPGHSRSHSPAPGVGMNGNGSLGLEPQRRVDHPIYTPPPSRPPSRGAGGSGLGMMRG